MATITHLELFEFDYSFFSRGTQASNILDYLKGFVNLRSLSIKYTILSTRIYTVPIAERILINLNVVDVLRVCPQMTHLQMYSEYRCPATSASDANASATIASDANVSAVNGSAINTSVTNASVSSLVNDTVQKSNVQSWHLMLTEFKFPYIDYVSQYTTANLSYLNIEVLPSIRFCLWIDSLYPLLLLAFTLRLKIIQHVIFQAEYSSGLYELVDTTLEHLKTLKWI